MPKTIEKALLPFLVCSQENIFFDDEVEKAAVFCYAELAGAKGGGFFRKRETEKLISISKVYYPFWMAPVLGLTLLLDGLNGTSDEINYPALPNLQVFKEKLNQRQITPQVYAYLLSNNQTYFQSSAEEQKLVEGLLNDTEFAVEFLNYAKKATTTD